MFPSREYYVPKVGIFFELFFVILIHLSIQTAKGEGQQTNYLSPMDLYFKQGPLAFLYSNELLLLLSAADSDTLDGTIIAELIATLRAGGIILPADIIVSQVF